MKKESKNTNTILNLVVITLIAIIIVSSAIGLYAWAKYTNTFKGEATAQVAKWHFDVKNANGESVSTGDINFPITRTDNNTTVAEGNLAPRNLWKV